MPLIRPASRTFAPLLLVLLLAGCSGGPGGFGSGLASSSAPAQPTQPPVALAGRWTLSSPGQGQCVVTLGAGTAGEGSIAPQGGCPGKFFTSRKWSYSADGLAIRDHRDETLAQLTANGGGGFSGQAAGGLPITLSR
jgi:hypothetical protein